MGWSAAKVARAARAPHGRDRVVPGTCSKRKNTEIHWYEAVCILDAIMKNSRPAKRHINVSIDSLCDRGSGRG